VEWRRRERFFALIAVDEKRESIYGVLRYCKALNTKSFEVDFAARHPAA
jgi:hypothetical protein